MADTLTDTRTSFSRITEGGSNRSWKAALPVDQADIGSLQAQVALATSPGRTTVILQSIDKKAKDGAWAAVIWGELPDGKTWMRVNAYGLAGRPEGGKAYHVWFQPLSGDPVDLGALEPTRVEAAPPRPGTSRPSIRARA